jgi:hypothetical protein
MFRETTDTHEKDNETYINCVVNMQFLNTVKLKKISCLRSQDKKAPKFSHFIKITPLRNFPLKK